MMKGDCVFHGTPPEVHESVQALLHPSSPVNVFPFAALSFLHASTYILVPQGVGNAGVLQKTYGKSKKKDS